MSVLALDRVDKEYPVGVAALRAVTVDIPSGDQVAVIGPSGSGKTTMLTILGTLERPTSGEVRVAGRDVAKASDRELAGLRAHQIGFVFQTFHLQDTLTAVENVATGMLYTGVRSRERREAAAHLHRAGRPRPPAHPPAAAALGRRAPARRDRTRPRQAAGDHPGRRADREPRLQSVKGRGPAPRARVRRRHARADHRRSEHRRIVSPTDPDA